ncbi:hypothetical protein ElyMa_004160200 [Elysia marginata]|uniref:Uncharacterized protein n=1 Tax=Elysia marginata TaxID=1093978 RepID=A0AAV4GGP2_9GAST|nr:hypothetical protein ElyMa_004160200 [Elysia marginata]
MEMDWPHPKKAMRQHHKEIFWTGTHRGKDQEEDPEEQGEESETMMSNLPAPKMSTQASEENWRDGCF